MYVGWLIGLVDGGRAYQHPTLFRIAWEMEYAYYIPLDANRCQDGLDLRVDFERETSVALPDLGPCRVLEFLVALAKRIDYILYDDSLSSRVSYWFWILMENLGIYLSEDVEYITSSFIVMLTRTYDENGDGGLFPLENPKYDQRKVEIWYQMQAWMLEQVNGNL